MRQIAQLGLGLCGAERVGHSTVGKNTCCCAVRKGFVLALTLSVQEATSSSENSLEETYERKEEFQRYRGFVVRILIRMTV